MITSALRFWEPRRVLYNLVLGAVVFCYFLAGGSWSWMIVSSLNFLLIFFILAVLANVCYCAAYVVDVFVQFSGYQSAWGRWRWLLWILGTAFAAAITRFFVMWLFVGPR